MGEMLYLTKAVALLLLPPAVLVLLAAFGMLMGGRKFGRFLVWSSLILLCLLSTEPVSDALLRPLESQFQPLQTKIISGDHRAIVLLGSGIYERSPEYGGRDSLPPVSLMRTTYAATLARASQLPVYASGGNVLHPRRQPEGMIMHDWLIRLGVPAGSIRMETASSTTCESAALLAPTLAADGIRSIVLVTSAVHMPRAMYCFAKPGIEVIPAPCAYLGNRSPYNLLSYLPQGHVLADSADALWEYLGMVWYRLRYSSLTRKI